MLNKLCERDKVTQVDEKTFLNKYIFKTIYIFLKLGERSKVTQAEEKIDQAFNFIDSNR